MKREIRITYFWKCAQLKDDNGLALEELPSPLAAALEESAMDRITGMMAEGYTGGELHDNVNIDIPGHDTPEDGYECSGWFHVDILAFT